MEISEDFEHVRNGWDEWLIRCELRDLLAPVVQGALAGVTGRPIETGRGGAYAVTLEPFAVIVRPYRRGGLPGRFLHDTYGVLADPPRPYRELQVIESLRRRNVPTIEPLAAVVRWVGWRRYRGWLVTRSVDRAQSLWQLLSGHPTADVRAAALRASATAIARLHAVGAAHPDLNLTNILVRGEEAWLIDFDRGRDHGTATQQRRALARLRRSARKLDPIGGVVTDADLAILSGSVSVET